MMFRPCAAYVVVRGRGLAAAEPPPASREDGENSKVPSSQAAGVAVLTLRPS